MPRPSDAQKEAGNYLKPRVSMHGLSISIENRRGTVRSGTDKEGRPWSVVMPYDYGYIRRTLGADGDQVDVFLGPNRQSQFVLVVNQYDKQTGKFDEVKVGLGYLGLEQAKAAYRQGYRGRNVPRAAFVPTTVQRLKQWLQLKQTWARFDFERSEKLTDLASGMPTVNFRANPEKEKPSWARRVAATVGGAAVLGSFYAYRYRDPAAVKRREWNRANGYRQSVGNPPALDPTFKYTGGDTFDYGHPAPKPSAPAPTPKAPAKVKNSVLPKPEVLKKTVLKTRPKYQDVTSPRIKTQLAKLQRSNLGALNIRLVEFQNRNADGTMGVSTNPLTYYRKASRITPWVGRAGQAAGDLGDMAAGKKVKEPFYKKSWFKRLASTAAIGIPLYAAGLASAGARRDIEGRKPTGKIDVLSRKLAAGRRRIEDKIGLSAKLPLKQFSTDPLERGWDLRDARGRSARVYAPGSRPRDRREKSWGEKTDNIRLVRNIAIGGLAASSLAALHYRNKAKRLTPQKPAAVVPSEKIVPFRREAMGARITPIQFSRKDGHALGKVLDAARDQAPSRPELPGEGQIRYIATLPPKKRATVLRILGAGGLAGTGVVAGSIAGRPRTGAALGGLGAGLILRG